MNKLRQTFFLETQLILKIDEWLLGLTFLELKNPGHIITPTEKNFSFCWVLLSWFCHYEEK